MLNNCFSMSSIFLDQEWTILDYAREGDLQPYQELFAKPDGLTEFLSIKDEYSDSTPLHMAAANGHKDLLVYLISQLPEENDVRKKAVNAPNSSGNTPLHWATLTGSLDCVKVLCEAGADPLLKNSANIDSCYQADCSNHEEVATYLYNIADPEDSKNPEDSNSADNLEGDEEVATN